jgi:4-carboxymuconolactone decarboxylase
MNVVDVVITLCLASTLLLADKQTKPGRNANSMRISSDIKSVAPALEKYAQGPVAGLWKRPGLTPRDRSIVTLAALIARSQTVEMPYYLNLALDSGVKPREISEMSTHMAFYSG